MASTIQTPDSLSLLHNLKTFIFSSSSEVAFSLKKGATTILAETYYPDSDGRIEIDVRDVVSHYLKTAMPSSNVTAQSNFAASFTAYLDETQVQTFNVVNAGVRTLSVTPTQFLQGNWLTWQPQTKRTTWNAPEYLTYYFTGSGTVKAKFYKKNGTTKTITYTTVSSAGARSLNMMMSYLFSLSGENTSDLYGIVDVWVEMSGSRVSYVQRYMHGETQGDEHYYLCVNSLGGIDTYIFHGACTLAPDIDHQSALLGDVKVNITTGAERHWEQVTGYASLKETNWVFELIAASQAWAVMSGVAEPIVIDSSSLQVNDRGSLHSCTFAFKLTYGDKYLNLARTSDALPAIEVPTPSGEIFFLTARLSEYPDVTLSDNILFLVQSPVSDTWFKTSWQAMASAVSQQVLAAIPAPSFKTLTLTHGVMDSEGERTYNGSANVIARVPSQIKHLTDRATVPYLGLIQANGTVQLQDVNGNSIYPAFQSGAFWGNTWNGGSVSGPLTFTAVSSPSAGDLEVIVKDGVRYLHTRLPFYSDAQVSAGGIGSDSSGGSGGSGTTVLWGTYANGFRPLAVAGDSDENELHHTVAMKGHVHAVTEIFTGLSGSPTNGQTVVWNNGSWGYGTAGSEQLQADWNQTSTTAKDFIKNKPTIPSALSALSDDANHRLVTDDQITAWNNKQNAISNLQTIIDGAAHGETVYGYFDSTTHYLKLTNSPYRSKGSTTLPIYFDANAQAQTITAVKLGSSGYFSFGQMTTAGGSTESKLTWDSTNRAWKVEGNLYVTGWLAAQGIGAGASGGGGAGTIAAVTMNGTNYLPNDDGVINLGTVIREHQSLTSYATKVWVQQQGYLTQHQSLSGYQTKVSAMGSTTKPVYVSSAGTFSSCSTYAGGTAVTLNGTSKTASTASFYAPTASGTSGQFLRSSGNGTAPYWQTINYQTQLNIVGNHGRPVYIDPDRNTQAIDYLNIGTEQGSIIMPFFSNDLSFLQARGGTCTITGYSSGNPDATKLFNGKPDYTFLTISSTSSTVTITIVLPTDVVYNYGQRFYIDFGATQWAAKSISLSWYQRLTSNSSASESHRGTITITDNDLPFWRSSGGLALDEGYKLSKLVITLTDFYSTTPRISEIGIQRYNSEGMAAAYMSRGSDDLVYRNISPANSADYSLGDSSHKWAQVVATDMYATNVVASGFAKTQKLKNNAGDDKIWLYTDVTIWGHTYVDGSVVPYDTTKANYLGWTSNPWTGLSLAGSATGVGISFAGKRALGTGANGSTEDLILNVGQGFLSAYTYTRIYGATVELRPWSGSGTGHQAAFSADKDQTNLFLGSDCLLRAYTSSGTKSALLINRTGNIITRDVNYYAKSSHNFSVNSNTGTDQSWDIVMNITASGSTANSDRDKYVQFHGDAVPLSSNTCNLGRDEKRWENIYAKRWYPYGAEGPWIDFDTTWNAVTIHGNLVATGAIVAGMTGTNIPGSLEISGNIIPTSNQAYSLGSSSRYFSALYASAAHLIGLNVGAAGADIDNLRVDEITLYGTLSGGDLDTSVVWSGLVNYINSGTSGTSTITSSTLGVSSSDLGKIISGRVLTIKTGPGTSNSATGYKYVFNIAEVRGYTSGTSKYYTIYLDGVNKLRIEQVGSTNNSWRIYTSW